MGKKSKSVVTNGKKPQLAGKSTSITRNIPVCVSVMAAVLGYALYHLFSIGAHLDWNNSSLTSVEIERHVMNDSISYQ